MPLLDLVVLVADADTEQAVRGILSRHLALGIRPIRFELYREPGRDSGCRVGAVAFLHQHSSRADRAIVVFDHEGSGAETTTPDQVEEIVEDSLARNGWNRQRVAAIVIAPELENWIWTSFPHIERVCNWAGRLERLSDWLMQNGFLDDGDFKPKRPKETLRKVLRATRTPPSPAIFRNLADRVSLQNCNDRAFIKLTNALRKWFPAA